MDVYWLEQTEAEVPAQDDWLSAGEALRLNGMRVLKRRRDWRLGRWTAKRAVAAYLDLTELPQTLAQIEIRTAPLGAPEGFFANRPANLTISLSHRAGVGMCAVAMPGAALGCDLEIIEPRSQNFVADYFTAEEQSLIERAPDGDRSRLVTLLWSAKESALKALRVGLRLDTRTFSVSLADVRQSNELHAWHRLSVRCPQEETLHGWWQSAGCYLRTLTAIPPPLPPIPLAMGRRQALSCIVNRVLCQPV